VLLKIISKFLVYTVPVYYLCTIIKNKQLKKEVVMVKKINRLAGGIKGVLFFLFWVAVAAFMVYMVINY
jgi:hypothetical protein